MDEIKLIISHKNNETYKSIELRKFFYMAFIGDKGKTLDLYIATVFGGNTIAVNSQAEAAAKIQYSPGVDCSLCFQFSGGESYTFEDQTQSFCDQSKQVAVVWGECKKLQDQKELKKHLIDQYKGLYPDEEEIDKKINKYDVSKNQPYFFDRRKNLSPFIAAPGMFSFSDGADCYTLTSPSIWPDGLEAINWIKTTITLSKGFPKKREKNELQKKQIAFSVEFEGSFFSPDFTWYFAPPRGFLVSQESKVSFANKDILNSLQSVSDYTTVEFEQWVKRPESILDRKKTRFLFPDEAKEERLQSITVSLQLENPHQHDNWQFFAGLLIAFLLAFCSDKTRINDYFDCLSKICACPEQSCQCQRICNSLTIAIPFLLLLLFMVIVLWPARVLPQNAKGNQIAINIICWVTVIVSLVATAFLILYVYVLWLLFPDFLNITLGINCSLNKSILIWTYCIAFFPGLAYWIYSIAYLKCKIYDYM